VIGYFQFWWEKLSIEVRTAVEQDKEKWNLFVNSEGGSFFQLYDWKYYYEFNNDKYRFIPLVIENNSSEILGIFPIVEILSFFYGSLSSLPLGASDGYLLKNDLSDYEKDVAVQTFLTYIDNNYSNSHSIFTIREQLPLSNESNKPSDILLRNGYRWSDNTSTMLPCTHIIHLEKPFEDKIWLGLWSKKLRKRIRHAEKTGAEIIIDDDFTYFEDFMMMQIHTAKKFGMKETKEAYEQIFNIFQKKLKLFVCLVDSKPISAALCYYTSRTSHLAMAPYYPTAEDYLTNTLPIYASIRFACEQGYQNYEMGITQTADLAFHKEKFGGNRIPMMIYQKKFSHFKWFSNLAFSYMVRIGKKFIRD
jgi:lipid II:glycine glycyltransferase (peptidoglycan interpeptide bridge formation enzyme)